jgi:hypothetical protein
MSVRRYYSARTGRNVAATQLDLDSLKRLFLSVFGELRRKGYFQEALGLYCVDQVDLMPGRVGKDIGAYFLRQLRRPDLWPINTGIAQYSEDDLFDVIELTHDLISKPVDGTYHSFDDCGWHYSKFESDEGQREYRQELNPLLKDYAPGYELSPGGELVTRGDSDLHALMEQETPELDATNVDGRVNAAVLKFRRRHATTDDKRDAVRDLADVLEYLRPKLSGIILSQDESDLFNIANNFGIRHHNERQRTDYDQDVWLDTLFYHYLNQIHTLKRLLARPHP